jgi:hypothetical protein
MLDGKIVVYVGLMTIVWLVVYVYLKIGGALDETNGVI